MGSLSNNFMYLLLAFLSLSQVHSAALELRRETSVTLSNCQLPDESREYPQAQALIQNLAMKIMRANPEIFHSDLDPSQICISVEPIISQRAWAKTDERNISIDAGLILRVQNEAQLAVTVAHELAHLSMRHEPLEGNPLPMPDRERANQLLIEKDIVFNQLIDSGKGPTRATFQERLSILQNSIHDLFKLHFNDEEIANWTETEADVVGAYYYLNTGYPAVELAWRHEQLVLGLQAAGINPITNVSGPNFDSHAPPSNHTSEQRAALVLEACRLTGESPQQPVRGTHRYPIPCWQVWNLKINLPSRDQSLAPYFEATNLSVDWENNPSLSQAKEELCSRPRTRLEVYCSSI